MLKKCYGLVFLLCSLSVSIFAQSVTKYEVIDMGVSGADESRAVAINDKNQVLGTLTNQGKESVFLWDKDCGLQILDFPPCYDLKLNSNGQIAGICSKGDYFNEVFIWDKATGFYSIGTFNGENSVLHFNDQGQILIGSHFGNSCDAALYLWDHGVVEDISGAFNQQFPEFRLGFYETNMNNKGEIVVIGDSPFVTKSFMWSQGTFRELFKEYGKDASVRVRAIDDHENICVQIISKLSLDSYREYNYFINAPKNFKAELPWDDRNTIIRNSIPQKRFGMPMELKKKLDGMYYYTTGAEIRKLIKSCYPYWFEDWKRTDIISQNSKGYVVGSAPTIYLEREHAFLAIPAGTKL